jgi:hypothetical protein
MKAGVGGERGVGGREEGYKPPRVPVPRPRFCQLAVRAGGGRDGGTEKGAVGGVSRFSLADLSLQANLARAVAGRQMQRQTYNKERRAGPLSPHARRLCMLETMQHGPQTIVQTRKWNSDMSLLEPEKTGPGKIRRASTDDELDWGRKDRKTTHHSGAAGSWARACRDKSDPASSSYQWVAAGGGLRRRDRPPPRC